MRFSYRPLPPIWPTGERTAAQRWSPFKASWASTLDLLERELRMLGVEADDVVVIEAGYRASEIRMDGLPRRDARPNDPAVILNFRSKFGPLRYGCDTFTTHEANLRGVALALEALRAVDRYGVSKRGEQYRGWLGLPSGEEPITTEEALEFLARFADNGTRDPRSLYRRAAMRLHPDVGGDPEEFKRLGRVKEVLGL